MSPFGFMLSVVTYFGVMTGEVLANPKMMVGHWSPHSHFNTSENKPRRFRKRKNKHHGDKTSTGTTAVEPEVKLPVAEANAAAPESEPTPAAEPVVNAAAEPEANAAGPIPESATVPDANSGETEAAPPPPEEDKPAEEKQAEEASNTAHDRSYDVQIDDLKKKISKLNGQLEDIQAKKATKSTYRTRFAKMKTTAKSTDKSPEARKEREERFKALQAKIKARKELEVQRYSTRGLYLQVLAEFFMTPGQRKKYHEALNEVNEKRRAEGKPLK